MRAFLLLPLVLAVPASTAAQPPRTVEVRLSNFDFTPNRIALRAGEPVTLRLVNTAGGGHDFSAPEFFAAARNLSGPVHDGEVELGAHQTAEVRLTPARGTYRLRCTHRFHSVLGMKGRIVVQ
jgi:plastocyanin